MSANDLKFLKQFPLEDGLVLYDDRSSQIHALDRVAKLFWELYCQGITTEEASIEVANVMDADLDLVRADTCETWSKFAQIVADSGQTRFDPLSSTQQSPALLLDLSENLNRIGLNICNFQFELKTNSSKVLEALNLIPGIRIDASETAEATILVVESNQPNDKEELELTARTKTRCRNYRMEFRNILPSLTFELICSFYAEQKKCVSFHAGAVSKENNCLIIPGQSNRGKSTLVSYLSFSGWNYLGDDCVMIDPASEQIWNFPMPAKLRPDSATLLKDLLPTNSRVFSELQSGIDEDENILFHLPNRLDPRVSIAPTHFIFPNYLPGAAVKLRSIPKIEALVRATESGYSLKPEPMHARMGELILLMDRLPCLELTYSSLAEAAEALKAL